MNVLLFLCLLLPGQFLQIESIHLSGSVLDPRNEPRLLETVALIRPVTKTDQWMIEDAKVWALLNRLTILEYLRRYCLVLLQLAHRIIVL